MSPKPAQNRHGSAAYVVLFLLAVCLGLVAYLWLGGSGKMAQSGARPVIQNQPEAPLDPHRNDHLGTRSVADATDAAPTTRSDAAVDPSGTVTLDPGRFKGRGSLAGTVSVQAGTSFPSAWTLVLEPSRLLQGREFAKPKRFDFAAGETDFAIDDLPLAGYDVHAEAPDMNGLAVPVLLERSSSHAYIMLELIPAGTISGYVNDHTCSPLEGIEVWLHKDPTHGGLSGAGTGLNLATQSGTRQVSGPDGSYAFQGVLDGYYQLRFGSTLHPLVDPISIQFRAPSLTVPAPKLPPLARLLLMVVDLSNQPVAGAKLRGFGSKSGTFEFETPPNGRIELTNLAPGRYEFTVEHELFGTARLQRQIQGGEDEVEVLVLLEEP